MTDRQFKYIVDTGLSDIQMTESRKLKIMHIIKGEKVVKRKISFSLVLALVIITVAAVAIAASVVWENYAAQVKQTEHEQGRYAIWPIKDKVELIRVLVDNDYIEASSITDRVFDSSTPEAEVHQFADQLLVELTQAKNANEINLDMLTYSLMGFSETWAPEQRVWWQKITNMYRGDQVENDIFIIAGPEDLPEEEAIQIAKEAILNSFEFPADYFDKQTRVVADFYVTKQRPDYRRWSVIFEKHRADDEYYIEKSYVAIVDNTGTVIADPDIGTMHVEDMAIASKEDTDEERSEIQQAILAFIQKFSPVFRGWTIEQKAEFSKEIRPQVLAIVESGDLSPLMRNGVLDTTIIAETTFAYGIPGNNDLSQDEAERLARDVYQKKYGFDDGTMSEYVVIDSYFDITDDENHLWKFVFHLDRRIQDAISLNIDKVFVYRVYLASQTGDIVLAEEFPWQELTQDIEYDLKWY